MDSPTKSLAGDDGRAVSQPIPHIKASQEDVAFMSDPGTQHPHSQTMTPEPRPEQQSNEAHTPGTPDVLSPFDWADFEARYERALRDADEQEQEILKEAEGLSKVRNIPFVQLHAFDSSISTSKPGHLLRRLTTMNAP